MSEEFICYVNSVQIRMNCTNQTEGQNSSSGWFNHLSLREILNYRGSMIAEQSVSMCHNVSR